MRIGVDARMIAHSGIGTYLQGLLHALVAADGGHEYVLFVNPGGEAYVPRTGRVEVCPVDVPVYGLAERIWFQRRLAAAACQVVHVPHYNIPWWPPRRTVVTVHDAIHVRFPEFVPGAGRARVARLLLSRAVQAGAALLVDSEFTRHDLERLFPKSAPKIAVAPPGLDPVYRPQPRAAVEAFRARHQLPERYVLFVGLLRPHKNVERLIEAFATCAPRLGPGTKLVVRGTPDERFPAIVTALSAAQGRGLVHWLTAPLDARDMPLLYAGAHVLVCPSLYEGFGLPVAEAMACGTPVVAARAASLPEVAGDAALWTDPLDVGELSAQLARASTDDALRAALVARGLVQARRFDWRETAERTLDVYARVARDGGSKSVA